MKDEFLEEFKEWVDEFFNPPSTTFRCANCGTKMDQYSGFSDDDKYYWMCPKCKNSFSIRDIFDGYAEEYDDYYEE